MEQELRRALQSQAGVKCSDTALLAQLGSAATNHGLTSKELASRLGAYLLNQLSCWSAERSMAACSMQSHPT